MEAKCDGCSEFYPPVDLVVMQDGTFWCDTCEIPRDVPILRVNYSLSFRQLYALCSYLDGDRDWDTVLEAMGELEKSFKQELLKILRRVLKKDDSEDPESVG